MSTWDPAQYLRFGDERTRPFVDLVGQIPTDPDHPIRSIVDVGCGPGHLMSVLRRRWPDASIIGMDSSAEMIAQAKATNGDAGVEYVLADASSWTPPQPVDLIISNATLQWLPDQFATLTQLLRSVTEHGTVAVGVPDNGDSPTHTLLDDLAVEDEFASHLVGLRPWRRTMPIDYVDFFAGQGFMTNAWSTTYLHILTGVDPVFEWVSGTRARPYLQRLDAAPALREKFEARYRAGLREAFPARDWGTPLPFRRTFAVAMR